MLETLLGFYHLLWPTVQKHEEQIISLPIGLGETAKTLSCLDVALCTATHNGDLSERTSPELKQQSCWHRNCIPSLVLLSFEKPCLNMSYDRTQTQRFNTCTQTRLKYFHTYTNM